MTISIMPMPADYPWDQPVITTNLGTSAFWPYPSQKTLRDFTTEEIIEELYLRKKEAKLLAGIVIPGEANGE